MIRILLPLICAALGFATASCSQTERPLAPAEAPASRGATSRGAASAAMANPFASPTPQDGSIPSGSQDSAQQFTADTSSDVPTGTSVERRASRLIGMPVVSADGSALGEVKDIIFDRLGRATHLIIAYGKKPQTGPEEIPEGDRPAAAGGRRLTAIPWDAAMASLKGGRLVLSGAILQGAPSFTPDAWPHLSDPDWSTATDTYWRKAVRAAIAEHPGTPIDSTSRSRARGARGGGGGGGGDGG